MYQFHDVLSSLSNDSRYALFLQRFPLGIASLLNPAHRETRCLESRGRIAILPLAIPHRGDVEFPLAGTLAIFLVLLKMDMLFSRRAKLFNICSRNDAAGLIAVFNFIVITPTITFVVNNCRNFLIR